MSQVQPLPLGRVLADRNAAHRHAITVEACWYSGKDIFDTCRPKTGSKAVVTWPKVMLPHEVTGKIWAAIRVARM